MTNRWVLTCCAAAIVLAPAACSSPPDYAPPKGELVAGTAQITVNGNDTGTTDTVQCDTTGYLTTITTGDQTSGVTAMVSNKDDLAVESVGINNVGGFTGSYTAGVGDTAEAADIAEISMTGRTYDISGTADGFNTDNPSFRASGTFSIRVSC
ncbi:lipoprotein LpqH [Mycolicibacterium novocastrense]|uniref:Lipoprotein LpqH n=1 Tax=Mycolicibacterium novocastrense TaxID=59813 RepID=A0AAW5SRE5_MYCNV|nr:lipoprotein LpqH [Mycolicibacterium novocastrense]MCV7026061.1 lipoprotein LpqH [Mycolicibacterium novocastrense]